MDRKFYVICADDCRIEGMSKEQIFAAIAEATGNTPSSVDDGFITKIKESNAGEGVSFWVGTEAEYNAMNPAPESKPFVARIDANGKVYIRTDDTLYESINNHLTDNTNPHDVTWDQVGAAPAGYGGYGEVITPRYAGDDGTGLVDESALEEKLNEIYTDMKNRESRRFVFLVKKLGGVTIGSWGWIASIYKSSANYAIVEALSGFGNQVTKITKVFNNGTWQPAEWVNPPLAVGVEYRTTEKFYGEPVYAKLVDFGAGPSGNSKSVYVADYIGDLVRVEGDWYIAAKTAKKPFATADFIDRFKVSRQIADGKITWALHIEVSEDASAYTGLPVVYYTKREW